MNAELLQRVECGTTTAADAKTIRQINTLMMQLGARLADAAMFFDTARAALAVEDLREAGQHIEHLHDVAQVLFGDRNAEMYAPERVPFEQEKSYRTDFALFNHEDPLSLVHWRESGGIVNTAVVFEAHGLRRAIFPGGPTELRLLAIALKQLAIALKQLAIALKQLAIALKQLAIALKQLAIALKQLAIALKQLAIALKQLAIALKQLAIALKQLAIALKQLAIALKQLADDAEDSAAQGTESNEQAA